MSGAGALDAALPPGVIRSACGLVINPVGIAKHQRDREKNFSGGVNVSLGGNKADAIRHRFVGL